MEMIISMLFYKTIKRRRTEMKNCIYGQFQLEDQNKINLNLCTEQIEGTKKKSKE